jgi:aminoglycoside 2'-N-acetyltransferase I
MDPPLIRDPLDRPSRRRESLRASNAILVARSRSSSLYFFGASIALILHGLRASTEPGAIQSHAAVVPRELHIGRSPVHAGYVEAVATEPSRQGAGYATQVMHEVDRLLRREFQIGALFSGAHHFYERLGWVRWRGPSYVRSSSSEVRTPDEDAAILTLRYGATASLDLTLPISRVDRPGDAWSRP